MAQVHAINSDKAIKAIKQAIACHGFCGSEVSEVPWKIKLRPRTFAQGQGQGLKICPRGHLKAKDQGQGQQHCRCAQHNTDLRTDHHATPFYIAIYSLHRAYVGSRRLYVDAGH